MSIPDSKNDKSRGHATLAFESPAGPANGTHAAFGAAHGVVPPLDPVDSPVGVAERGVAEHVALAQEAGEAEHAPPCAEHLLSDLEPTRLPGGLPRGRLRPEDEAGALPGEPSLFGTEAMGMLREQLIGNLGADMARGVLSAWGYELGRRDALGLGRPFSWENDTQLLLCGPRLLSYRRTCRMETRRLALNRARSLVDVEVVWHRSPEAEQYVERLGHAEHAVCWTLCGYYSGYCTTLLGREVLCIETTCTGMGADCCTLRLCGRETLDVHPQHRPLQPGHVASIMKGELEHLRFDSSTRITRLLALREAVLDLGSTLMLDGVQAKIVSRGRVLLGARYSFLLMYTEPLPSYVQSGMPPAPRTPMIIHDGLSQQDAASLQPFPLTLPLFAAVLRDNATVRVRRAGEDPRARGLPPHPALSSSFLGVPVRVQGQLFGALYFTARLDGGEFTLDDEKLAESFAAHAGVALENARLHGTIAAERDELRHSLLREQDVTTELHKVRDEQERERDLLHALITIPEIPDVDSALHRVLDRLVTLLDADVGTILLCGSAGLAGGSSLPEGALRVRAFMEGADPVDVSAQHAVLPPGVGISARVLRQRDVVYVRDVADDPDAVEPHLHDRGVRSLIGAPLVVEGRLIGVVHLGSYAVRTFDGPEVRFLHAAANLTALSIEHARLHEEVMRSDQLLRAVIEAAPVGVSVTVPPDGETLLSNGAMRRLMEIGAQAGTPPAGDAPLRALCGEVVARVEQTLVNPITGAQVALRISAAPVRSTAFTVQAAVTVVEELTLEKEIERLRERFVQLVVHDLRNPLSAAMMHLSILRERLEMALHAGTDGLLRGAWPSTEGQKGLVSESLKTADAIHRAMERVGDLARDLQDYSQLEAGQLTVHRAEVALRPLLRELLDEMRPLLGERVLDIEVPDELPPLFADRRRLAQVLTNLLSNAAKYTHKDVRVGLRARLCDPLEASFLRPIDAGEGPEGMWVLLTVWDAGPGIPRESRRRLFDPFYRLSRDQGKKEGTGLGLYITRGLVEAHGGQLWIDDVPGASFSMLWPVVP